MQYQERWNLFNWFRICKKKFLSSSEMIKTIEKNCIDLVQIIIFIYITKFGND